MILATPVGDQIRDLQNIFGGGVLGAVVAVVLLAFLGLFLLFVRAKNAHLETALKLAPVADQMTKVLAAAVEELAEAREIMQLYKPRRSRRAPPLSPEAATVIVRSGEGDEDEKDQT